MYKVLIVEDEAGIRNRLHRIIDWAGLNCEICGEADSGMAGFEAILKLHPDIVLTDIVMPGISGIALLQYVRQKDSDTQFIFLTGYQEFEYAKEALSLGATALLTKPVVLDELKNAILKAVFRINSIHLNAGSAAPEKNLDGDLLANLLQGQVENIDLRRNLMHNYGMLDAPFAVAMAAFHGVAASARELESFNETMLRAFEKRDMPCAQIAGQGVYALFSWEEKEDFHACARAFFERFIREEASKTTLPFSICLSPAQMPGDDPARAREMCTGARRELFFASPGSVVFFRLGSYADGNLPIDLSRIFSESADSDAVAEGVRDVILKSHLESTMAPETASTLVSAAMMEYLIGKCRVDTIDPDASAMIADFCSEAAGCANLNALAVLTGVTVIQMRERFVQRKTRSRSEIVSKISEYIEQNYASDVSLRGAAKLVYLSPAYLSSIIRQETGRNFVDIVNEVRIRHAQMLLMESGRRTADVAAMTGFQDPHYFSRVFRKVVGMSPGEFARKNGN